MSHNKATPPKEITIGLIEQIFVSPHVPELFQGSNTHDPALKFVHQIIRHTQDRDTIHAVIGAALPGTYEGDTPTEIDGMIDWALDNPSSSRPKPQSQPSAAQAALDIPAVREIHLFHTSAKDGYATVSADGEGPHNEAWRRDI